MSVDRVVSMADNEKRQTFEVEKSDKVHQITDYIVQNGVPAG
jgi:hypothetical protein